MLAKLHTFSLLGIDALPVEVEVDVSPGALPKTVLVGLPEAAVKESTHRVERALVNSGFLRPQDKIVINRAPAHRRFGRKPNSPKLAQFPHVLAG
jgi:magnesium chelatase family protein